MYKYLLQDYHFNNKIIASLKLLIKKYEGGEFYEKCYYKKIRAAG